MNGTSVVASVIAVVVAVFAVVLAIFHFWVFPTMIEVLRGIDFVNVSEPFTNALYWLIIGLFVLFGARSFKANFKNE